MSENQPAKPFIKKFVHQDAHYIYDVNTNRVVEVEKPFYDIIDDYHEDNASWPASRYNEMYTPAQIRKSIAEIEAAKEEYKLFSSFRPRKVSIGPGKAANIKELHREHGLKQLLLEVTKACTLNCSYCSVSGKYADTAVHRKKMSKDTCFKAVDFYCERSVQNGEAVVGFYGGEPLLRFDLMKDTVEYVKEKYGTDNYEFNLTTNGTVMNEEIIDFFAQHDFHVSLSLDGPKSVTDRYRLSRDGVSTFDTIMKNLEFIKRRNPDFFSRNISISSVLAPPFQLDEIADFFSSHQTLRDIQKEGKIRVGIVNTRETTFLDDFNLDENMKRYRAIFDGWVENLKKIILEGRLDKIIFEKQTILDTLLNLAERHIKELYDYIPPMGACHIGLRRLFVNVDGGFNICERVNFENDIGSIHRGFDYDNMAALYRKFDVLLEDCNDCWALNHCERCWASFTAIDNIDKTDKEKFCRDQRDLALLAFKTYVELLKENPDSLKILEKYNRENAS